MATIGNQIVSAPYVNDVFSGTGSQTAFTLTFAPATTAAIAVHVAGVYQAPSSYTLSGTTLTFNSAPAVGSNNIQVLHLSIGFVAQVPSDGSVTTAKIATDAIITDKIANANVTNAKIVTVANTKITGVITSTQLANTAVTTGTYGGASNVSVITVDQQGRVTSASNVSISIPSGSYVTNTNNSILTNNTSITSNATINSGTGGLSVGPITISANVSVTVANNARYVVL